MHRNITYLLATLVFAMLGFAEAAAQDITTGIIGFWKLDEGLGATTAVDSAPTPHNGAIVGAVTTGLPGRVDNGYQFAGTNGNRVLTTANADNLGLNSGPFSMFAFIKTPTIGTAQRHIFTANGSGTGRWNLDISATAGNLGKLSWFHNGPVLAEQFVGDRIDDDLFHLVGVSKDASNNYVAYVDANTYSLGVDTFALSSAFNISLGERPTTTGFPFKGTLDDMRIYNRVLTALDIQALLNQPLPPPSDPIWSVDASGSWHSSGNWSGTLPNGTTAGAVLSSLISAPRTIAVDQPVTLKKLTFDNAAASYVVGGTSTLTFDADSGNAKLFGLHGSHNMQVAVELADSLDADIAAATTVSFDNALKLNGNTLAKTGAGRLNINNLVHSATGTVNVSAGTLGGNGEVGGVLNNQSGGTVAPGTSAGTLSVTGNYVQSVGAKLQIELAGAAAEQFDVLDIDGTANLAGTLEIALLGGFTPSNGQSFPVLTASGVTNSGLTLSGASTGFSLQFNPTNVTLLYSASLPGDFNHDNKVDAADYVLWRKNPGAFGDAAGYTAWRAGFGLPPGSGSSFGQSGAVPEPTTALLLAFVAAFLPLSRKR